MADKMDFDDMDELVEVSAPPPKPSKFAPKSSNFAPKQRPKKETTILAQPKPESASDVQPAVTVKKEKDSCPAVKTEFKKETDDFVVGSPETVAFMEEDEEDDYVVSEIDVYFNRPPIDDGTQLYILQYPLRQSWRTYELDKNCTEVRMKPNSSDLQVDLSIDLDSGYFSHADAASMGFTKLMLESGPRPQQRASYAIGVLVDHKLHLNPVHAIRQLKPSMDHLDVLDSKNLCVPEVSGKAVGSSGGGKAVTSSAGGRAVGSSEKQNQAKDLKDEEMWVPLKYHGSRTAMSAKYLQKMRAGTTSPLVFSMRPTDYLESFGPRAVIINKNKQSGQSIRSLLSFSTSLEERFKLRLAQGPPIQRFNALRYLAPSDPLDDIFRILQELAVLVQGLWVPKTPVRYPNADGHLSVARDSALLLFSRNLVIKDSVIDDMKNKVRETMKNKVLPELAQYRKKCQDWKFKEPADSSFLKLYSDIVSKQNLKWQEHEKQLLAGIFKEKSGLNSKSLVTVENPGKGALDKGAVKSASGGLSVRRVMSDQTRDALPKVLKKLFQTQKIWSFQTICQGLRDMAVSMSSQPKTDAKVAVSAANGVEAPEELLEVINEIAINIHGVFVQKSSSEHPEYDPLRNVVIDLFIGRGPNGKLRRAEIVEAAKITLKREPTTEEFRKVISEFCVSSGAAWVLKSVDGPPT